MNSLLDGNTFGNKLYNRFPQIYKSADATTNYALKRFIESLSEGGFKYVIEETNGLIDLVNNQKVPVEYLDYIFKSYGLEVFHGLPEIFLRNLVPSINELFQKKGSITVIEYLAGIVSGVKAVATIDENYVVDITLKMDSEVENSFPNLDQLKRIAEEFLPFYCRISTTLEYVFSDTAIIDISDTQDNMKVSQEIANIKVEKEDSCFLNSKYCLLSDSFYLNTLSGYDTVINNTTGEEKIILNDKGGIF